MRLAPKISTVNEGAESALASGSRPLRGWRMLWFQGFDATDHELEPANGLRAGLDRAPAPGGTWDPPPLAA
jgi:hypothetical protein